MLSLTVGVTFEEEGTEFYCF